MNKYTLCANCNISYKKESARHTGWYSLNGYHGIQGAFCPKCFKLVEHDSLFHRPKHPRHYAAILFKQQVLKQHEKECE